jgi:hypothetical protein
VQPDVVGLIGHVPEDGPLSVARIRQQGQGLIAVTGEDHLVKMGSCPWLVTTTPSATRRTASTGVARRMRDCQPAVSGPMYSRATRDHIPLGPVRHLQQPVVGEKPQEEAQGEGTHVRQGGGPDGRPHGQDVVAGEIVAEFPRLQEVPQGQRGSAPAGDARPARPAPPG